MKKMILAGGSGFLGGALARHFRAQGWDVVVLTRTPRARSDGVQEVAWDGRTPGAWAGHLEAASVVINLTGRSVDCRYHAANRREIIESRVDSTRAVGEAITACRQPPSLWLNASSATLYRHTFDTPMDEQGEQGATPGVHDAFSIEVIRQWERALELARTPATRKVAMRTTMILGHARNSVFPVLRRLAYWGLGGSMGSGRQYVSWMHEKDFAGPWIGSSPTTR